MSTEIKKKLLRQFRNRELTLAARTTWWMTQECWHEWRWGIASSNDDSNSEFGETEQSGMYQTMGYETLRQLFREVAPRATTDNEVLLDAGCGLGRVLIEAARHPYAEVLGFDYSRSLIASAQINIKRAQSKFRCPKVEAIWGDAATYTVPDRVTTIFLFNPFRGELMQRFMSNVQQSIIRRPRRLRVLFSNPLSFNPNDFPWLKQIDERSHFDPHLDRKVNYRIRTLILEAG